MVGADQLGKGIDGTAATAAASSSATSSEKSETEEKEKENDGILEALPELASYEIERKKEVYRGAIHFHLYVPHSFPGLLTNVEVSSVAAVVVV